MNETTIKVRAGRMDDLDALATFTHKTFHWGDYILEAWPHWVESPRGELLVAEVNGAFAGTAHVRYLEQREAWLEGVRVHPAFRRRNIATTLVETAHARAKQKRCRTMRLETGSANVKAQRLFQKLGYRCVADFARYRARAAKSVPSAMRLAKLADASACWELWLASLRAHRAHPLTRAPYGWRWWEFSPPRLREAIRAGHVWLSANARAFMVTAHEQELQVVALAGAARGVTELLQGARVLAEQQNLARVYWFTPDTARAKQLAAQNRFALDDSGRWIYEHVL